MVNNTNLLLISETKPHDYFLTAQFQIKGFSCSYRYDRNGKGGGLLLYIRNDIQSRLLICKSECNIETLSVEVNLSRRKWHLNFSYNPHESQISTHLESLNCLINDYSKIFGNLLFIMYFNVSINHNSMVNFNDPICYKSFDNPTSIELILTNSPSYFQRSTVFGTDLSDFNLLNIIKFKKGFQK